MKKLSLIVASFLIAFSITAQESGEIAVPPLLQPTSVGVVIYSNDIETVINAMRFANFSLGEGDTVSIFLFGKGVEVDKLVEVDKDVKEQVDLFLGNGGNILGCGTCLRSRKNDEPQVCKFSSMSDLYSLVRRNKIVLTF
jgi:uncharacterized protein involved in oxidation of intracellular sulfur